MWSHLWKSQINVGGIEVGEGKNHYSTQHIVATTIVSTQSSSGIQVIESCVGLNYKSIQ